MANDELTEVPDKPSKAYNQAKESLVYRLSELMFGSLLAAYAIGFLGFLANLGGEREGEALLLAFAYLSVSVTYAYATVALYLTYHAAVLTMHHMPLENLRYDFLLVVSEAVGFGFSMAYPWLFPLLLSLILWGGVLRLQQEHKQHIQSLHRMRVKLTARRGQPASEHAALTNFTNAFNTAIKDHPSLSGWKPVSWRLKVMLGVSTIIGLLLVGLVIYIKTGVALEQHWATSANLGDLGWFPWIVDIVCGLILGFVMVYGNTVISDRATFLYDGGDSMNTAFQKLLEQIGLT